MSENMKLNVADEKLSKSKVLGFSLLRLGNILQGLVIGEVTYFSTNSLAISAAAISIGIAIKTAIDALTDLIMGSIVDNTHTRFGKARPWALAGVPMWICMLFIFLAPRSMFNETGLVIYITVLATLDSAVFSTMANIAYETHIKRCVVQENNRLKILTIIGVVYAVGALSLQIALPAVISAFNGSQSGFIIIALVTGVIGILACIAAFILCKEYSEEELAAFGGYSSETVKEKVPLGTFLKSVVRNKYLFMYTVINFLYMLVMMSSYTVGQYYFQYNYGSLSTFSIVMAFSAGLFPIYIFIPKMCGKWGTARVTQVSMFIAIIGVIVRLLVPGLLVTQVFGYLCVSLPNIFVACVGSQINYECMEYGRYKTGVIAEGMYSAFISFAQKMSTSLSSVLVGLILTKTGFDYLTKAVVDNGFESWDELSAMGTAGYEAYVTGGETTVSRAFNGISMAYNWMPLVFLVICIVIFFFFNLERDLKRLRVENGLNEDGSRKEEA